ncbi:MAG: hypothetical protein LJE96_22595 [Deltaproteobacteria bacterium]|nr:hypothetical protein [Deltaproteobacteria bacterium]
MRWSLEPDRVWAYKDVWVSETGQYILSNDVTYNPNEQPGAAVNWQRAKVVK